MSLRPLTTTEIEEERALSEKVIAHLQKKLDGLSLPQKHILHNQTVECVEGALSSLIKKLGKFPDITLREPEKPVVIKWGHHAGDEAFSSFGKSSIEWGKASSEENIITILTLLSLAPKEIIRQVATHEALHVVYSLLEKSFLQTQPQALSQAVKEYPDEAQAEEQWVRDMMKRLGFKEHNLEFWELAVEIAGDNWHPLYYQLKKRGLPTAPQEPTT